MAERIIPLICWSLFSRKNHIQYPIIEEIRNGEKRKIVRVRVSVLRTVYGFPLHKFCWWQISSTSPTSKVYFSRQLIVSFFETLLIDMQEISEGAV